MRFTFVLAALSTVLANGAYAACPEIEGKYTYQCRVDKDAQSQLGEILQTMGHMLVQREGCQVYRFTDTVASRTEVIDLAQVDPEHDEMKIDVKKSNAKKLKVKTVARPEYDVILNSLIGERFVSRVKIRKTRDGGFKMRGREKSRYLGLFRKGHSKFTCRFQPE